MKTANKIKTEFCNHSMRTYQFCPQLHRLYVIRLSHTFLLIVRGLEI
ncbi:hypothetical protein [Leptospira alexanderi]|nr:hypothetical protein [Leptospira alexanderi]